MSQTMAARRNPLRQIVLDIAEPFLRYAARSYVVGTDLEDAVSLATELTAQGSGATICYWNDIGDKPEVVADIYRQTIDHLSRKDIDGYLSLKAPALENSIALIEELAAKARELGIKMHFDSHGLEQADAMFDAILRLGPGNYGCTLPGRWLRSLSDAELVVDRGVSVRVVKGEWNDPDPRAPEPRRGFLDLVDRLAGRARHVGVATHDPALAGEALRRLMAAGTSVELELLYGLPYAQPLRVARELGVRTRFYLPYGKAWLPYSLGKLPQKPQLIYWLVRDMLGRRSPAPGRARERTIPS